MLTRITSAQINTYQEHTYDMLNNLSTNHRNIRGLLALPVAILDVATQFMKTPLHAIESAAMAVINLIGASFSNRYTLADALISMEMAIKYSLQTPVCLLFTPFKIMAQFFRITTDPQARSINEEGEGSVEGAAFVAVVLPYQILCAVLQPMIQLCVNQEPSPANTF
ncbi:MAG: hypothetical protein NT065_04670 [Chlamydiae bacterium]|nr:hypothetical protein [Chlamydiota bacterium]